MSGIRELFGDKSLEDNTGTLGIVEMDDDDAAAVFETLSTETTISIYTAIQEDPKVAPELQDELGTSIQNIHYHLSKLEEAGLIEPVGSWVSETGVDMDVYGPVHDPLVISFADADDTATIKRTLRQQFRILGVVSFVSLLIEYLVREFRPPADPWRDASAGGYPGHGLPFADVLIQYPGLVVFTCALVVSMSYVVYVWASRE